MYAKKRAQLLTHILRRMGFIVKYKRFHLLNNYYYSASIVFRSDGSFSEGVLAKGKMPFTIYFYDLKKFNVPRCMTLYISNKL